MNQQNPPAPVAEIVANQPRPFFKKKRFLIPAGFLLLGIALGSCSGGTKQASDVSPTAPSSAACQRIHPQPRRRQLPRRRAHPRQPHPPSVFPSASR
jgi:hypothetical protein